MAQAQPAVPPLRGAVNDQAQLLSPAMRTRLEQRLTALQQQSGLSFAFLSMPSLEGANIEDFSIRVVEAWKLGSAEKDNGLLLLVAPKERKLRIEVGYGLEGAIPDAGAARIIRDVITPAFRAGQMDRGIEEAFLRLEQAALGDPSALEPPRAKKGGRKGRITWWHLLGMLFFIPVFFRRRGRGSLAAGMALGGLGRGYGRSYGGGFGGGGFSGGGGGFGGGGASGSW